MSRLHQARVAQEEDCGCDNNTCCGPRTLLRANHGGEGEGGTILSPGRPEVSVLWTRIVSEAKYVALRLDNISTVHVGKLYSQHICTVHVTSTYVRTHTTLIVRSFSMFYRDSSKSQNYHMANVQTGQVILLCLMLFLLLLLLLFLMYVYTLLLIHTDIHM